MKVIWTQEASLDRQDISEGIATDNLSAAKKLNQQFDIAASRLAIFPRPGRPGSQTGTREIFPHENYRLVYEIADDTVWIVALIQISRKWPPTLDRSGGTQPSPNEAEYPQVRAGQDMDTGECDRQLGVVNVSVEIEFDDRPVAGDIDLKPRLRRIGERAGPDEVETLKSRDDHVAIDRRGSAYG